MHEKTYRLSPLKNGPNTFLSPRNNPNEKSMSLSQKGHLDKQRKISSQMGTLTKILMLNSPSNLSVDTQVRFPDALISPKHLKNFA